MDFTLQVLTIWLFSFTLTVNTQEKKTCYFPDLEAKIPTGDVPCVSEGESFCCGQGFACLSNKLCKFTAFAGEQKPGQPIYGRGSCTDSSWNSPDCPNYCIAPEDGDTMDNGASLGKCANTIKDRYYCINNLTLPLIGSNDLDSLCSDAKYYMEFEVSETTLTIIGVAQSSTSSSTSTPTITPSFTNTASTDSISTTSAVSAPGDTSSPTIESNARDLSVPIGAGVGVPLGVIVIGAAGILFYRYRYRRSRTAAKSQRYTQEVRNGPIWEADTKPYGAYVVTQQYRHEMPVETPTHELPGDQHHGADEGHRQV
ncbi:hypothetical protein CC78DRAFT_536359 [Lojkania enalia]|uniref:Mid2 domain-containing protein n=1 Tax=Lojkania enalia TaxID=147567 RepID=A0A9P4MWR5_9PLEO|nr:hypothetical protein CC78DRAFT_536359 [Didymosphaeria enalia]